MRKIIKSFVMIFICMQMTLCFGCGDSDESSKKSSSSKSKNTGYDTPEEAVNAYLNTFIEQDSKTLYGMVNKDEWDIFYDYIDDDNFSKKDMIGFFDEYMREIIDKELSRHPKDEWKPVNEGYDDVTDEFLDWIDDFGDNIDADGIRKQYKKIGLQKVITYDWVVLEHKGSEDFIECITDDLTLVMIDGKWYLSFWNFESL